LERVIRECYTEAILDEAMRRYGIAGEHIRSLDAFESFIYEFEREGEEQAFILRIAHSSRRSEALILGEVDWINYLAEGGVPAARPTQLMSGLNNIVINNKNENNLNNGRIFPLS